MSLNPFGEAVIPRSLDNERLFAAWFQLADAGACRMGLEKEAWKMERERKQHRRDCFFSRPPRPPPLPFAPQKPHSRTHKKTQSPHNHHSDNDGKLTGAEAVAFFERSGLPRPTLAKVWTLADAGRRGFLDKKSFAKAMELIGIAQRSGKDVLSAEAYAEAAARADLDPPMLEGVHGGGGGKVGGGSDDGGSAQPSPRTTATASPSGSGAPSPPPAPQQQQYAYAQASSSAAASAASPSPQQQQQQRNGGGGGGGGKGSSQQPSMKTITGVVDGLKQIYFSKGKERENDK